jgi:2-hydroxy-6-oxonona-2,4-dienedioate hydrolase
MPPASVVWPANTRVHEVLARYRTRVVEAGEGRPLVVLHGQGGHAENYRRNIEGLARRHRVLAPDFIWHGRSECPDGPEELIPELVEHIDDLLDRLGVGEFDLIGQSMGGLVALHLARRRPGIGRLVLVTPMGVETDRHPLQIDRLAGVLERQLRALEDGTADAVRRRLAGLLLDPSQLDDVIVEVRRAIYADPDTNSALRRVAVNYFDPELHRRSAIGPAVLGDVTVPTLVYWGSANPTPVALGEDVARHLRHGQFHCSAAGHWAHYERPEEFNGVVGDFLQA